MVMDVDKIMETAKISFLVNSFWPRPLFELTDENINPSFALAQTLGFTHCP